MTKTCTVTVTDEVYCIITGLLPSEQESLWKAFGIFVDGYFFMPAYKMGRFDGKIRFYQKTGKTYLRMLDKVLPYIESWGYDIDLVDNRKAITNPGMRATAGMFGGVTFGGKPFELRPYQVEAVNEAIDAGSGFIIAGTGSGKCFSGSTIINIKVNTKLKEAIEHVRRKNLSSVHNREKD